MNLWLIVSGILGGLGVFLLAREIMPAPARLDSALARLDAGQAVAGTRPAASGLARRLAAELPWVPVPSADLALLGQDRETWLASKVGCGLLGLALPAVLVSLAALGVRPAAAGGARRCLARLRRGPVFRA